MRATLVLAFVLAASACDGGGHAASVYALLAPGELDAASAPAGWSAPGLLRAAVAPSGLLDPPFAGDCPRVTAGELETTVEGGCTDAAGRTWHGRATLPSRSQGGLAGGAIVYEGFGVEGPSECRASGGRAPRPPRRSRRDARLHAGRRARLRHRRRLDDHGRPPRLRPERGGRAAGRGVRGGAHARAERARDLVGLGDRGEQRARPLRRAHGGRGDRRRRLRLGGISGSTICPARTRP
ncbi:MAG: hypothetical protein M5U28_27820 [Sandaracinaceae bacterium]|nr:hypothetical protein [Sandaracinaceae bacterium]